MIRIAGPFDIEPIIERLLIPFHAEHELANHYELDIDMTVDWISQMVEESKAIVVDREGEIAGGIGLREYHPPFTKAVWLVDDFFYVRPEWRGDTVGLELARYFRDLAALSDKAAILTVFNSGRMAKRGRISQIFGWLPFGHNLLLAA